MTDRQRQNADLTALYHRWHNRAVIDWGALVQDASSVCQRWHNCEYVAQAITRFYSAIEAEHRER